MSSLLTLATGRESKCLLYDQISASSVRATVRNGISLGSTEDKSSLEYLSDGESYGGFTTSMKVEMIDTNCARFARGFFRAHSSECSKSSSMAAEGVNSSSSELLMILAARPSGFNNQWTSTLVSTTYLVFKGKTMKIRYFLIVFPDAMPDHG